MKHGYIVFLLLIGLFAASSDSLLAQVAPNESLQNAAFEAGALSTPNAIVEGAGYPWISQDGLRLYYTGGGVKDAFYVSSRVDRNASFGEGVPVFLAADHDVLSCWLTPDELEMWYVERIPGKTTSTTLSRATRNSVSEHFGSPVRIELGLEEGFIAGPSLSEDQQELFLYLSSMGQEHALLRFRRTGDNAFEQVETLDFGNYTVSGPGRLAHQDLRLYVCLGNLEGEEHIYYIERTSQDASFALNHVFKLTGDVNISGPKSFQPALTPDEKEIFFTRNPDGMWEGNALWSASIQPEEAIQKETDEEEESEEWVSNLDAFLVEPEAEGWELLVQQVEEETEDQPEIAEEAVNEPESIAGDALEVPTVSLVYPNPSSGIFNFELNLPQGAQNPVVEVYSIEGVKQGAWKADTQAAILTIDLSELTAGTYLYRLVTDLGTSDSGKLILVK